MTISSLRGVTMEINDYTLPLYANMFRAELPVPTMAVIDGLIRYVEHRLQPGDFLYAVLTNDLYEAVGRADFRNALGLSWLVGLIYNCVPSGLWGSKEKVDAHLSGRESDPVLFKMDWGECWTPLKEHYEQKEDLVI